MGVAGGTASVVGSTALVMGATGGTASVEGIAEGKDSVMGVTGDSCRKSREHSCGSGRGHSLGLGSGRGHIVGRAGAQLKKRQEELSRIKQKGLIKISTTHI